MRAWIGVAAVLLGVGCEDAATDPLGCPAGASPFEHVDGARRTTWCERADGAAHGPYTATAEGAVVVTGRYVDGRKDGPWRGYDLNGGPLYEETWAAGARCGVWVQFVGQMRSETDYGACDRAAAPPPATPAVAPVDVATLCGGEAAVATPILEGTGIRHLCADGRYAVTSGDRVWSQGQLVDGVPAGTWHGFHLVSGDLAWTGELTGMGEAFDPVLGVPMPTGDFEFFAPGGALLSAGALVDGVRQGPWTEWAGHGGAVATGAYVDGRRDGLWQATRGDAPISEETWQAGQLQGPARRLTADGVVLEEGAYQAGEREGPWVFRHPEGPVRAEGTMRRGFFDGVWSFYDAQGRKRVEATYRDTLAEGDWPVWVYRPDGTELEGTASYRSGLASGVWRLNYVANGAPATETTWVADRRNGPHQAWYPDGQVEFEGAYVNDLMQGRWRWYYPDGQLRLEGDLWRGVRVGPWVEYWPDGSLRAQGSYSRGGGRNDDWTFFAADGTPRSWEDDMEDR